MRKPYLHLFKMSSLLMSILKFCRKSIRCSDKSWKHSRTISLVLPQFCTRTKGGGGLASIEPHWMDEMAKYVTRRHQILHIFARFWLTWFTIFPGISLFIRAHSLLSSSRCCQSTKPYSTILLIFIDLVTVLCYWERMLLWS